jgi:hypothetical protein
MREQRVQPTWSRTKLAAVAAAIGLTVAVGTAALTASPAHACPGHPAVGRVHPHMATE